MQSIKAFIVNDGFAQIKPLIVNREWMDNTHDGHAYKYFPVSITNQMGWSISYPEDISFIWDGISDTSADHIKILKGKKYAYTTRANATVSFHTGINFETDENITLLAMPAPNFFIDGATAFTTLMSTSFFKGELPVVWRVTRPNQEITIKANTPIVSILPINLNDLQNSEINIMPKGEFVEPNIDMHEYSNKIYELNMQGKYANFYRNATDHIGNSLGSHQVKSFKLFVNDKRLNM